MISASRVAPIAWWTMIDIPSVSESRGCLTFAEADRHVPFAIERVYWIHGVPEDGRRGGHAHRSVYELVIAAAGAFDVRCDNGEESHTVRLDDPARGLLLDPYVWRDLSGFSRDALCLVLASGPYDEDEYVRDYAEFVLATASRTAAAVVTRPSPR